MTRRTGMVLAALAMAWLGAPPLASHIAAAPSAPAEPWTACREQLARSPDDYESAYCFYAYALEHGRSQEAIQVFEALLQSHPGNLWLPLAYGHLHRSRGPGTNLRTAELLYRRSADGFRADGHAEGEVVARISLRDLFAPQGRIEEATAQIARVVEIGATAGEPVLKAQVAIAEASHLLDTGGDLGHAYRLLKQAERAIFPEGPYRLQRTCATWLGLVTLRLGRLDEAIGVFRRLDTMARAEGDLQTRVNAQYNILNTEAAKEVMLPTAGGRDRLLHVAREVLALSTRATQRPAMLKAHWMIADLLAEERASHAEALTHVASCVKLAVDLERAADEALCSWLEAMLLQSTAPGDARAAQMRALRATERANRPSTDVVTAGYHMKFSWLSNSRPDAIRDSLSALEAIETLRSLQDTAQSSAEVFSIRTHEYYWLSGRLLHDLQDGDVDLAFSITERVRARALLDMRSRTSVDSALPAAAERKTVLREIASIQRTLMDPTLAERERRASIARLETLEEREQSTQRLIELSAGGAPIDLPHREEAGSAGNRRFASLADVQASLASGEALLSFQVGTPEAHDGNFGGGSWLIVVTRNQRAVHRIADRSYFAQLVPVFTGLLSRGDGLEAAASVRLHGDVFADAIRRLPPDIHRLILVPDGPLQHLPFEALRAAPDAEPLGSRYELLVIPSATLWLEWRRQPRAPAGRRVLALADPALDADARAGATARNAVLQEGVTLGRLPHARRESRAIRRRVGNVDTLVGPHATEQAVKTRNLRNYEIVHFAAHAVADDRDSDRSAVFLAPGSTEEDGLLQGREIRELDLEGRIVVLSACRTASGAILSGEGVMSLARAFFAARARAVVGTRWPIRDEDAATLFESFYRHLGRGASLSSALMHARMEAIADGLPARAWAALVLIGDGSMQPFPDAPARRTPMPWTLALAIAVSLVGTMRVLVASRRS